jgi:hypothetical protein
MFLLLIFLYCKNYSPRILQARKELLFSFLQCLKDYKEWCIQGVQVFTAVTKKSVIFQVFSPHSW